MPVLQPILTFAHQLLRQTIRLGDTVVDATMGNGHDSVFLARCVGTHGTVWAFDVQADALSATAKRAEAAGIAAQLRLLHRGHEHLAQYVRAPVQAAIFNLGYLPGADKNLTTRADTTEAALNALLPLLAPGGLIVLVIYGGHPQGALEQTAVEAWARALPQQDYAVLRYQFANQINQPPYLLAVEALSSRPAPS